LTGHRTFTTWPEKGGVDVLVAAGATSTGPGMVSNNRGFAHRKAVCIAHTYRPRADVFTGMAEFGIKLSGVEGISTSGTSLSIRMWMSKPLKCLPNHCLLRLLHLRLGQGAQPRPRRWRCRESRLDRLHEAGRDSDALARSHSEYVGTDGSPNPDGEYIYKREGKTILHVTGRRIFYSSADYFDHATFQNFHGGSGCPISPLMDVSSVALHMENGPLVVATTDPGPLVTTTPARPAYIEAMTIGVAATITSNVLTDVISGGANQVNFSGPANVEELGVARVVWRVLAGI
jgi:hypothetical protein